VNFTVYPSLKHLSYFLVFVTTGYLFLRELLSLSFKSGKFWCVYHTFMSELE